MFIRMLQDRSARARDNLMVRLTYESGKTYEVDNSTGRSFISRGWAEEVEVIETLVRTSAGTEVVQSEIIAAGALDGSVASDPADQIPPEPTAEQPAEQPTAPAADVPTVPPVATPAVTITARPDEAPKPAAQTAPATPPPPGGKRRSFKAAKQEIK